MKTLSEMKSGVHRHQHRELFERTLDDDEIEALIDKARESALAIKKDKKREKEEREQAKEVLDFIDDVEDIWDKKKSLHPSQVVALMKVVAGTSSSNPAGWGWKTKGFSQITLYVGVCEVQTSSLREFSSFHHLYTHHICLFHALSLIDCLVDDVFKLFEMLGCL